MNTGHSTCTGKRALTALMLAMGALLIVEDASAIIGRPFTPMSYAGVARRTTRRAVYATAAVSSAATVSTLPGGCMWGTGLYTCGATHYRPVYSGTSVVYVVQP